MQKIISVNFREKRNKKPLTKKEKCVNVLYIKPVYKANCSSTLRFLDVQAIAGHSFLLKKSNRFDLFFQVGNIT